MSCGYGTVFDSNSMSCTCAADYNPNDNELYIAGLFNIDAYEFGADIFNFTIELINNKYDGWYDDILPNGMKVISTIRNSKCDATNALSSYWDLERHWGKPLHGVIGCSCSGASKAVARIAGLQSIPMVSPSSTSAELSDTKAFSTFSRMVAADNRDGQVGALVSLIETFGWSRVGILTTDTAYASDMATEFANLWKEKSKEIAYESTIDMSATGGIDRESLKQTLDTIPTDEPRINSRVILLFAHNQDAQDILRFSKEEGFQPDTIWIGTDSWTGRSFDTSWLPEIPGYIGLVPYRSPRFNTQFLKDLNAYQRRNYRHVLSEEDLNHYVYEVIPDATAILVSALSGLMPEERNNGTKITEMIRGVMPSAKWHLNGDIRFTQNGDRADPLYSVMNYGSKYESWRSVGRVSIDASGGLTNIDINQICWASNGCGLSNAPGEKYDIPPEKLPIWVLVLIPIISAFVIILGFRYYRTHSKKKNLRQDMTSLQEKMEKMKNIDSDLTTLQDQLEEARKKQRSLVLKRADLQETPTTWTRGSTRILNEVDPTDDEYWTIHSQLKDSMNDAWISKLWRVQNESLWTFYSFHKDKLTMNGVQHTEMSVWHGTSSLDPGVIFNDTQDGFMMQFSRKGFWGRGIYFAKRSSYSYSYSFTPGSNCMDREDGISGEREMFLAKLLVGNQIYMDRHESPSMQHKCAELTVPPVDPKTGLKYNTVSGTTGGSQVWIVYENGRAYPDYLVRYYRGTRDPSRTPYESRHSSSFSSKNANERTPSLSEVFSKLSTRNVSSNTNLPKKVTWEYQDGGWHEFHTQAQTDIENFFQNAKGNNNNNVVRIWSGQWHYDIDIILMTQTNVDHANRKVRKIRRRVG